MSYERLSMGCEGQLNDSQDLSASGGCPPYTWNLTGGGTLTPSGGDNSSATYEAPASNSNCANNAMITLKDSCRNIKDIQLAVNCGSPNLGLAYFIYSHEGPYNCRVTQWYNGEPWRYDWEATYFRDDFGCDGTLFSHLESPYPHYPSACFVNPSCPQCPTCGLVCQVFETCDLGTGCTDSFPDGLHDKRNAAMKEEGCCPLNPETGLPIDGALPDSEEKAKNLGPPDRCEVTPETPNRSVANPVNVATGNKYEEVLDLSISTPGIPLEFRRSYNSQIMFDGPLGYGWTHTYYVSLNVVQTSPVKRVRIWDWDGRALYFTERSSGSEIIYYGESGVKDRLKEVVASGEYFLRRKEGNLTYEFGSDGKLNEISDPNGNTLTLTYTSGLLTQVSGNFGKSLSIQYTNNRISSITDPKSQSISYGYTNGDLTSVTYPDDNSISYAYSNHLLTDKYDTDSNHIGHWGYDGYSRVNNYYSHIKDSVHQEEITLAFQLGGTDVTRSTGTTNYTTAVIDGITVVQEIEGCSTCGGVNKSFEYSNHLELTDVTFIDGQNEYTTHYVYDNPQDPEDKVGEITEMTEALGKTEERTTTYAYTHRQNDPFLLDEKTETKPSVVSSGQNKVVTFTYDTAGNITSREETGYVLIDGTPTQRTYATDYVYNENIPGQLIEINGPRASNSTTFEYYDNTQQEGNNRGQLKAIVNALGQRTEFSNYDANGNVGKIKDPNNVETQYTYDERNRIKTIENLTTDALTEYSYDARGNLDYVILPEGNQIDFTYNLANKLTEIKDSLDNKIQYQYDIEGNRIKEEIKDPQGTLKKQLDFTYDAYNRLKKIINPDATSTYTEYNYDGRGNRTSIKDPKDNTTSYVYDALSRLTQINQPLSTTTNQGYDTQDNPASVTDPKNNTTQYVYDDFGRKNQATSPDTGATKYEYDEAGNVTKRVDANGTTVNYTYDALNRLASIDFPGTGEDVAFTYDSTSVTYGKGRLTGRTDPSGSYTFYYNAQGNLTKEEKTINSVLYTTEYGYDNDNNLTSITYPGGREVTFTLDVTGRVTGVDTTLNSQAKTLASSISYLPYGGITGLTYGNNLSLSQGHDNQYRTSSILVDPILDRAYEYDANGNITSVDDGEAAGNEVLESAGIYTYDQGTNLLAEIWGLDSVVYDYDNNGNTVSANNRTFVYDSSNRLITVQENSATVPNMSITP
jgi:YD repeat-containing protein